jgi:hypothetical protein
MLLQNQNYQIKEQTFKGKKSINYVAELTSKKQQQQI